MIILKTQDEIEIMAESGKILGHILKTLQSVAKIGMTTKELDNIAYRMAKEANSVPAFLNYRPSGASKGYPASICASINDVIVHGLPSNYVLKDGDLLKIDSGVKYKGYCSDSAITIAIGNVSETAKRIMRATELALIAGISQAIPGNTVGDIGFAVESVAHKNGFSIADGLTGHGIGRNLHEDPYVFNFGKKGKGELLREGMVIAIEPMLTAGRGEIIQTKEESYATADGSLSAHFEHTVAITKNGPRILTLRE
jgi:methionyl aminopeptidase